MSNDTLEIKASLVVAKPAEEVYEAIVNPAKMTNYFISKGSGRMGEGRTITWRFPEMDLEFLVQVKKVEAGKYISYTWADFRDGTETLVEIALTPKNNATFATVTEKSRPNDETGIKWLKSNTEGWANFLACLKAYFEYGINPCKGAFDPSQMPDAEK